MFDKLSKETFCIQFYRSKWYNALSEIRFGQIQEIKHKILNQNLQVHRFSTFFCLYNLMFAFFVVISNILRKTPIAMSSLPHFTFLVHIAKAEVLLDHDIKHGQSSIFQIYIPPTISRQCLMYQNILIFFFL